MIVDNSV